MMTDEINDDGKDKPKNKQGRQHSYVFQNRKRIDDTESECLDEIKYLDKISNIYIYIQPI